MALHAARRRRIVTELEAAGKADKGRKTKQREELGDHKDQARELLGVGGKLKGRFNDGSVLRPLVVEDPSEADVGILKASGLHWTLYEGKEEAKRNSTSSSAAVHAPAAASKRMTEVSSDKEEATKRNSDANLRSSAPTASKRKSMDPSRDDEEQQEQRVKKSKRGTAASNALQAALARQLSRGASITSHDGDDEFEAGDDDHDEDSDVSAPGAGAGAGAGACAGLPRKRRRKTTRRN